MCRLPDQAEVSEAFFRQVKDALCSQASLLLGNLSCLICCKGSTGGYKQSRTFLECAGDNFLAYVNEELMRESPLLDLIQMRKKWLEIGRSGAALGAVTMRWCDGKVNNPERRELSKKCSHSPGLQESLKTCLWICLEESCGL